MEKNISIVNEVFVLNREGSDSVPKLLSNITISKMNPISSSKKFMREKNEKISTNNFIKLIPWNSNIPKEDNLNNLNNLNSKKSPEKFNNSFSKTPNIEFRTLFKKTNILRQFSPDVNNDDCNFDKNKNANNNKNNDNLNLNSNYNIDINDDHKNNSININILKKKIAEEEKSTNRPREEINSTVEKYLTVRKSEEKLLFGCGGIMNIICNSYCKRKISQKFHEKFNFYEKARNSVSHFFDFIFMIKKFEEINILKNCLLSEEQAKMVEIMCKPILSSKEFTVRRKKIRHCQNLGFLVDLYKGVNEFIDKVENDEDKVDRRILRIMEENVRKIYD